MEDLRAAAGIPEITVNSGLRVPFGYATRTNDSAPWKGGGRTIHGRLYACTTGFAVLDGGYGRIVTARHCDTSANLAVTDGAGQQIAAGGASVSAIPAIDSLLIDPSASPATTPKIFYGAYNTSTTKTVKSWASNWPGDPVCASGASTGSHCGTVYDDNDSILLNGYAVPVIQVAAPSGSIMGGQGDSGGSMVKLVTGGVQARGILLGPDTDYPQTQACGTVNPDVGSIYCGRYLNYVPIGVVLNSWGVALETG